MSYVPELLAERNAILRAGLDLAALRGLEIAPLAWPTVRRAEGRIRYIDHFDTETLRARYRDDPNVPTDDIVAVDALWGEQTLADCLGGETVDYIIASHVGEHVPDLVTWLAECDAVLAPGGELRLVLPDRRFSPDALRRDTNLTDVLAAHVLRARRPQVREVLDFLLHDAPTIDRTRLYRGDFDLGDAASALDGRAGAVLRAAVCATCRTTTRTCIAGRSRRAASRGSCARWPKTG